jgi:hypothetical protein
MDQTEWYSKRREILKRRDELAPMLQRLSEKVSEYFEGFEPDPLTGRRVFDSAFERNEEHPIGIVTVTSLLGPSLTISVGAESTEIVLIPKPANTTGEIVYMLPANPGDERTFVQLKLQSGGTTQIELIHDILRPFVDAAFARADRAGRLPKPKLV